MTRALTLSLLIACGGGAEPADEDIAFVDEGSETELDGTAEASEGEEADAPPATLAPPMAAVLAAHNHARAEHCAPPLEWSTELANTASRWANELASRGCPLEHSQTGLGENLFAATAGSRTPAEAVQVWVDERDLYDFDRGGFSMQTGHFTQVVWKGTQRVGCATLECNGLDFWVCNYDPAGNMRGGYQANVSRRGCD